MSLVSRRQLLSFLPAAAVGTYLGAAISQGEEIVILDEVYGGGRRTRSQPQPQPQPRPVLPARFKRPIEPRGQIGEMRPIPAGQAKPFAWGPYYSGVDWAAVNSGQALWFHLAGFWEAYRTKANDYGWFLQVWLSGLTEVAVVEPWKIFPGRGRIGESLKVHARYMGLIFDEKHPVIPETLHCKFRRYRTNGEPYDARFWSDIDAGNLIFNLDTMLDTQLIPDPRPQSPRVLGPCLIAVWGSLYEFERFGSWTTNPEPAWHYMGLQEAF